MASATATQALEEYARLLEAALACVTQPHFVRGRAQIDARQLLTLQQGVVRLRRTGNRKHLYFDFGQSYRFIHLPDERRQDPYSGKG